MWTEWCSPCPPGLHTHRPPQHSRTPVHPTQLVAVANTSAGRELSESSHRPGLLQHSCGPLAPPASPSLATEPTHGYTGRTPITLTPPTAVPWLHCSVKWVIYWGIKGLWPPKSPRVASLCLSSSCQSSMTHLCPPLPTKSSHVCSAGAHLCCRAPQV